VGDRAGEETEPTQGCRGRAIAPFDEVFHPTAYSANLLWEAEQSIPAATPDADGTRPDLASGHIRISLPEPDQTPDGH
jgi:hypothetical protein